MKRKYITLDLLDKDYKYINDLKKKLFQESNNPSFNLFTSLTILGETNLTSIKNINIKIENPLIEFENYISIEEKCQFIKSKNNNFVKKLKDTLIEKEINPINLKEFSLSNNIENYPIIYLGTNKNTLLNEIQPILIKDIRLNIIEIEVDRNSVIYNTLSSIHLSMDKNLLESNQCN